MRTDANRNPTAFTTDIAKQAGLRNGREFTYGTPFPPPSSLFTALLLGDPITTTIQVIDKIGYRTAAGTPRWTYICLDSATWDNLTSDGKRDIIGFHYRNEGGVEMRSLFPHYEWSLPQILEAGKQP